jgi:hypothetical protein
MGKEPEGGITLIEAVYRATAHLTCSNCGKSFADADYKDMLASKGASVSEVNEYFGLIGRRVCLRCFLSQPH